MTHHFRTEFDMVKIPGFVKRVVFPVVVALGRVLDADEDRMAFLASTPRPA